MGWRKAVGSVALVASLVITGAAPALADSGADRVRAARVRAQQLHEQAARQQAAVAVVQARLIQLSDTANAALASYQKAASASAVAAQALTTQQEKLDAATADRDGAQARLADYARDAYIAGPAGTGLGPALAVLQTGDPTAAANALALLGHIGDGYGVILDELRSARRDQAAAADRSAAALALLRAAEARQAAAKARADTAVSAQAVLLRHVKVQAATVAAQARAADATALRLKRELDAEIAAARARAVAARAGALARCEGGDISGYPNGRIPVEKLCPLYGAPGEELRSDAAARFNQMSRDYQRDFGSPICVADSYRTYERQQQLYASEPGYAAYPGTSQHGWALAVDLCGGIQTDGTAPNMWMRTHAAQYGWFHPTWADPDGGGPYEPWHWEFSG